VVRGVKGCGAVENNEIQLACAQICFCKLEKRAKKLTPFSIGVLFIVVSSFLFVLLYLVPLLIVLL